MNTISEIKSPKTRTQRLLFSGLLMISGVLGICWAGFKYASAESDANKKFAFLDQFDLDKNERNSKLAELRKEASLKNELASKANKKNGSRDQGSPRNDQTLKIQREDTFYSPNLLLDLSDKAIEERITRDVNYLSSDELEGRGIRTRGLELAGDYLANEFHEAGLYSAWYGGTPFQEFQLLNGSRRGAVQRVLFNRKSGEQYLLTPNVDFSSLMKTTMGTMTLDVVFAGYGITAPELGYDDYENVRVAGKVVIVLRHEPHSSDPDHPFASEEASGHAPVYSKIQNAIAHGATAVILCDQDAKPVEHPTANDDKDHDPFSSDLFKVEFSEDAFDTTIPVIHCRQALLDEVFQEYESESLKEVEDQIDSDLEPRSRLIEGFQVGFEVTRNRSGRNVRNVLASIEPNGAMPENTIVIGAHYDHLGRDGWGSLAVGADGEIHNGADDNASGTATIIEIARQLSARRDQLKSRVLFIAFTAEELGLLGSKHYIRDPAVPLNQTIAMINLDMVGRLREKLTIYGVGTSREWNGLIDPAVKANSINVDERSSGYGPSDHAVFYERGIPVLHFFTGFHPQYHRPADDSHLLNIQGMRQISKSVTEIVTQLAAEESPLSGEATPAENIFGEGSFSELLDQPSTEPPKFGVVVGQVEDGDQGLLIRKILPRSIAAKNGLQPGDIILQVGDDVILSVKDLKTSITKQTSGTKVPVLVTRRSLDLEIEVGF